MNITIVKSSTTIEVINDYKLIFRRDGGFHTAEVRFYSTSKTLLTKWDRVTFAGRNWRVSQKPLIKIDYTVTPTWLYTINLVETIAMLEGFAMPNITFTQDVDKTKTFRYALDYASAKHKPLFNGETDNGFNIAISDFDLSGIAPDDKFENKNLLQIFRQYGDYLDAKPFIDDNGNIDFEFNNDDNGEVIDPDFTSIEYSETTEDFCNTIIEDAENVEIEDYNTYPNTALRVFLVGQDITQDMEWENATIKLPHKVKRLVSLSAHHVSSGDVIFLTNYEYLTNKYIFEEKEWNTLNQDSMLSFIPSPVWGSLRSNSIYYTYGSDTISNLVALKAHLSDVTDKAREFTFQFIYEALPDIRIIRTKGTTIDGGYEYVSREDQQNNTLNLVAEGNRLAASLENKQSDFYNVTWASDDIPNYRSKITVLGSDYLMTELIVQSVGEEYECSARISTIYNKKNPLTKPISINRIFDIPKTQTTVRKIVKRVNAYIEMSLSSIATSEGIWENYNYLMLLNVNSSIFGGALGNLVMFGKWEYASSATYVYTALPFIVIRDGDCVVFVSKMKSNTSIDDQRIIKTSIPQSATSINAIVTDENGENTSIEIKFILMNENSPVYNDGSTDYYMVDNFPYVSQDFFDDGVLGADSYIHDFPLFPELFIFKDAREQLQFEVGFNISGANETIIDIDNIISSSRISNDSGLAVNIKYVLGGITFDATGETVTIYSTYLRVDFNYVSTGKMTSIMLYLGSILYATNETYKSVINGNRDYITISIKE